MIVENNKTNSEKERDLDLALSQIRKTHGKGSVMRLSERPVQDVPAISTGSLALDLALGIGGLPKGRIVEIFGTESAGKSTLALSIVAQAQKANGQAAYIDTEHALDPTYAQNLGVNLDRVIISQPDSGEQALDIADQLIRSGSLDVVVVDSVAALVPIAELNGEMGGVLMGAQARLMSQAMRKLTGTISRTNAVAIFINQLREKVGVVFGNPEVTPGGRALKFHASVRIDLRRIESIKSGEDLIGNRIRARVVKNKVAPPFRKAEIDILFNQGISKEGELLDIGAETNVLVKRGAFYSYGDTRLGQGKENARAFLRENPEMSENIESEIRQIKSAESKSNSNTEKHPPVKEASS